MLDAHKQDADWRSVSRIVLRIDPHSEADRARGRRSKATQAAMAAGIVHARISFII
jgi:hypothetical protein